MKIKIPLTAFAILFVLSAMAQDIVYRKDKTAFPCKIREIGLEEIKYLKYPLTDSLVLVIAKDEVVKVKFESGQILDIKPGNADSATFENNNRYAFKIDFLSPFYGHLSVGLEKSIKPGQSVEYQIGFIGLGNNPYAPIVSEESRMSGIEQLGFFVRYAYKFIREPDFYVRGMKYAHLLKGSYFKPEVLIGAMNEKLLYESNVYINGVYYPYNLSESINKKVLYAGFFLCVGKQSVYYNTFLFDYYVGVGYGFTSKKNSYLYTESGHFSEFYSVNPGMSGPISGGAFSMVAGIKFGFLFDHNKTKPVK